MASPAIRPCVLSKKRQHNLNEEYEDDGIVLSTSHLATLNESIAASKKLRAERSASSLKSSSGSESESEGTADEADNNVVVSATAACEVSAADITAVSEEAPNSPQPGPSGYEDITFEPAVTSTPHHTQEGVVEGHNEAVEEHNQTSEIDFEKEMQHARAFVDEVEENFLNIFRLKIKKQTAKHILKLEERRTKVSKAMENVKKDRQRLDNMFAFLVKHQNDIDNALYKFKHLVDRYPY